MPFWRAYYHIVWGTKERKALITSEVEPILYQYLINKGLEYGVNIFALNGWFEHIHIVCSIPPKHSIAATVKRLKGASSHYINGRNLLDQQFEWQRGYGVFTLGEGQLDKAIAYVENQKTHHQSQTTNGWLERVNVSDEGPKITGLPKQRPTVQLKEKGGTYETKDSFPFPF